MEELSSILAAHAARYPGMAPQDAVKLLYQNEFGGGHLISDPAAALAALRAELRSVAPAASSPLLEELGNGMARVNLAALDGDYSPEELNDDFVRSANGHQGSMERFLEKLEVLRSLTGAGRMPFSPAALEGWLAPYLRAGCPPVSHSEGYRAAHAPAYRVVKHSAALGPVLRDIRKKARAGRVVAAIDGRCASGKSTLATEWSRRFGWPVVQMDHFFLRPEQQTPARYAAPGENIDHERFLAEVLLPLRSASPVSYRPFRCRSQSLGETISLPDAPVVLVEGSYSCHRLLAEHYDLRIFLNVDPAEQLRRIETRNGPKGLTSFRERWIPLEELYFAAFPPEGRFHHYLAL